MMARIQPFSPGDGSGHGRTIPGNPWFKKITAGVAGVLCAGWISAGAAPVQHSISAANIAVVQNDTGNATSSVTVTTTLSINDFRIRAGSTRADYNVQIGGVSTDDVTNGILISSIDQNGRDNGEVTNFPGMNYGTSAIDSNASSSPGSSGEYWIPVFQSPANAEYNFNVAAAYFPYTNGWYGGWLNNSGGVNGGANNHLLGHPSLVLGTHVIDNGSGKTTVNLLPFGLDARSNAVLLVVGGKNEANFAVSATNANGTWSVFCRDDNGSAEQDYIAFVCIPLTNHTVVSGKFMGDASIILRSGPFQVSNPGIGTYHLTIPGVNPADGVLIISPEGGGANNGDNLVSYQVNGDGWNIQTRDQTTGYTPALQNLPATDAVVSFVYIPSPTPDTNSLQWSGSPTNQWDLSGSTVWRVTGSNTPASYADGSQTTFNDGASNFVVNLAASVAPSGVIVSNNANNYVFGGSGKISGPAGLTKQGNGRLILDTTNDYTGDTILSQGILVLGAAGAIPGGNGFGDVTVNGTLDVAGVSPTINNLSGSGKVDNLAAGGTVKLTVYETASNTFSGILKNTSGSLALALDGGGILSLTGGNTFSGPCTVSNGTLVVNGSLGAGGVEVQTGARLAGTGTINGPAALADGCGLGLTANLPLTVGALTLNGSVSVNVSGNISLTSAGTYVLLQHGVKSGSGAFTLVAPPGLQCYGFTASLMDTGTQLRLVVAPTGTSGTIGDVRHVVILMNENRSFDHYFGTLHGVRGFNDRNALCFTNKFTDFYQPTGAGYELPFHTSIQCLADLNHTWPVTHATVNGGKNDQWIPNKGTETMAYYERSDLAYYYALADAYTICDEYHCSVLSSTFPNRLYWLTGMIDPHGLYGGPEIDNTSLASGFTWTTYPERLQQAGISWKVYQVAGDNSDNVLNLFAAYKNAHPGNPLYDHGRVNSATLAGMVSGFQADVANNTLPAVSWIIGPGGYTEHPPGSPANGESLTKQLIDAIASNPTVYNSTVFIFDYDENDGFYDHAIPILPPTGTPDEMVGSLPIGLGIRVPAMIVSPWSRGGRVCSQVFDHTSVIRFLENWTGVKEPNISAWRRQVCGDLTSAVDFAHPNTNRPVLAGVTGISCDTGETPAVPSPQVFPVQEAGTLTPLPLPYQPDAFCTLNLGANTVAITMTNSGTASVHFGVYPNAYRNDGPWPFDVVSGQSSSLSLAATAGKYDFTCYGPDGFQRRFAGSLTADYHQLEALGDINPAIGGIKLELVNATAATVAFTVTNGYLAGAVNNYVVLANHTNLVNVGSETNNGLYDVTVTTSADSLFLRRFLGRVQTSANVSALTSSKNPSVFGDNVTFTTMLGGYGTPTGSVQFRTNGVAAGAPVGLINGTASITTGSLAFGTNWIAAEYAGDFLNQPATNWLSQVVVYETPVISSSAVLAGGDFQFNVSGPSGQPYRILSTTNLALPGGWIEVFSNLFGGGGSVFTETNVTGTSARFYRVVSP